MPCRHRTAGSPTVNSSAESIAADIQRYCSLHSDAADTVDGIVWWLLQQRFQDARAEIEVVIADLVRQGVLERRELADGTVLYLCRSPEA